MIPEKHIWIFNAEHGRFPGGVFTTKDRADTWIKANRLSGVLTVYPVDEGCFDWATANEVTGLTKENLRLRKTDPKFIGSFSTASQEHFHYEDGTQVS